jgi:phage shock protein C
MRRLYKSRKNRVVAGICGGIAEYFNVDPVLIRVIAVLFFFTGGAALIAYIVGMFIIPDQPREEVREGEIIQMQNATTPEQTASLGHAGSLIIGVILIVFGVSFLMRNIPFFHHYWWFWDMGWRFFWPSILIVIGLLVIIRGTRK